MKVKKLASVLMCLVLGAGLAACGGESTDSSTSSGSGDTTEASTSSASGNGETADNTSSSGDKEITIALMMKSMASEWNQNIEEALLQLGEEKGFNVLTFDCDGDSATMLDQMNDAVNQNVDGFFMHIAEEGIASAAVEIANNAGIPIIGESLPLKDDAGNWLAPCVVVDSEGCGYAAAEWIAESWESTGVDLSDPSSVGVVLITNSLTETAVLRHEAAEEKLKELMPDIPDENYFIADLAGSSADYIDGGYQQTGAVLAAHPEMTSWIVIGVQDDYASGGCRAVEEAGGADNTILVSIGGERAIPEWDGGLTNPWYATVYYTAMDFTEPVVDGLLSVINGECTLEEVYADKIEDGQTYGVETISGYAITYENYTEHVK